MSHECPYYRGPIKYGFLGLRTLSICSTGHAVKGICQYNHDFSKCLFFNIEESSKIMNHLSTYKIFNVIQKIEDAYKGVCELEDNLSYSSCFKECRNDLSAAQDALKIAFKEFAAEELIEKFSHTACMQQELKQIE